MPPELAVIIPTLNEVEALPGLLADLAAQEGVTLGIVVSDGGSTDGTVERAGAELARLGLTGTVLRGAPGRGRQLNRAAAAAAADWLLFLHADSRLTGPHALAESLAALKSAGVREVAGHFNLSFALADTERTLGHYLCEIKPLTGFPWTIHGDQGFLLPAGFFRELGGFREDLPVLEDTLLAEGIRQRGRWMLLPATLVTSPRRFRSEGLRERQTLNALLVNFAMIGWFLPLLRMPELYRTQDRTGRLDLGRCFGLVDECLRAERPGVRLRLWYRTGAFVRANAWQLVLRRAARQALAAGLLPAEVPLEPVRRWRRRIDRLSDHPPGRFIAGLLTWLWFRTRPRHPRQGD